MLTLNDIEECLSQAYVMAIAGRAGVNLQWTGKDYGIDGTFRPISNTDGKRMPTGFPLDFQLKSSTNCTINTDDVLYDLDAETHRKLARRRQDGGSPVVLIVLALPSERDVWLTHSEEQLLLRKCCYWYQIEGPESTNSYSVRIRIPRNQQLTPETLIDLLLKVKTGALT